MSKKSSGSSSSLAESPLPRRRQFTLEFKQAAVRLVTEERHPCARGRSFGTSGCRSARGTYGGLCDHRACESMRLELGMVGKYAGQWRHDWPFLIACTTIGTKTTMTSVCRIARFCVMALLVCGLVEPVAGQTLEEQLLAEPLTKLAQAARDQGDAVRGAMVFHHSSLTCVACHSVGDRPNAIGPDLTKLAGTTSDESLVESLLEPSKVIAPAYAMVSVQTSDGLIVSGVPVEDTAEKLVLSTLR